MSNHFPTLQKSQRIEVYLQNGDIKKGTFCKWISIEGANYLFVDQDERIENGRQISRVWWMSEAFIKLIYPL